MSLEKAAIIKQIDEVLAKCDLNASTASDRSIPFTMPSGAPARASTSAVVPPPHPRILSPDFGSSASSARRPSGASCSSRSSRTSAHACTRMSSGVGVGRARLEFIGWISAGSSGRVSRQSRLISPSLYLVGAGAEVAAGSGSVTFRPPERRSSTDCTASRVVRSFSASSSGAVTVERLIRLSTSG